MKFAGALAVTALLVVLVSCGSEDKPAADVDTSTGTSGGSDLGNEPIVPLSGAEICDLIPAADVTAALGTEVPQATPFDLETPLCEYSLGGDSWLFQISAPTPDRIGATGLQDSYDALVDLHRRTSMYGGGEEAEIPAGDRAIRLTGADGPNAFTIAFIASGGHLLQISSPGELDLAQVDAVVVLAATAAS